MIKKIKIIIKLNLLAGKATVNPPVGPMLGQHGINLNSFCKEYNEKTSNDIGLIIPVKITIYEDKSYSFILKSSPVSKLLLKFANIEKGSNEPNKKIVGTIKNEDIEKIIQIKKIDFNTNNKEKIYSNILGTAKNMGIKIID